MQNRSSSSPKRNLVCRPDRLLPLHFRLALVGLVAASFVAVFGYPTAVRAEHRTEADEILECPYGYHVVWEDTDLDGERDLNELWCVQRFDCGLDYPLNATATNYLAANPPLVTDEQVEAFRQAAVMHCDGDGPINFDGYFVANPWAVQYRHMDHDRFPTNTSTTDAGVHKPAIDALAQHVPGIFDGTGCQQGFCPDRQLQRWEMAVWLVGVLDRSHPTPQTTTRFDDVNTDLWWAPYTDRLAELRVTAGCATGPLRFCPTKAVTRAQMATFFVLAFDLEPAPSAGFTDTQGNTHEAGINAIAAAGITAGCKTDPPSYCPQQPVTRAQMATFLARALGII